MELTPQEAKELGIADGTPKIEFPPGMQNGD
jgi:hypothetical protein